MEYIQKAIRQAKKERIKAQKKVLSDDSESEEIQNVKISSSLVPEKTHHASESGAITYSQTKVIKPSQDELAERRLIAGLKNDPRSTLFKMLRTQVLQQLRENNWNSLAITAATQGAGKSLIAANLAISISLEVNHTVLLVDLDLRRPSIHKYFGFEPEYGLHDYLIDDINVKDILVNPGFERLVLLPGKGTTYDSSELISTPKMMQLVEELKHRYKSRIVIFDLPPLLALDDSLVFIPHVDSALMVVENGKNTEDEVVQSLKLLEHTNLIGTVLNKVDEGKPKYYYGY